MRIGAKASDLLTKFPMVSRREKYKFDYLNNPNGEQIVKSANESFQMNLLDKVFQFLDSDDLDTNVLRQQPSRRPPQVIDSGEESSDTVYGREEGQNHGNNPLRPGEDNNRPSDSGFVHEEKPATLWDSISDFFSNLFGGEGVLGGFFSALTKRFLGTELTGAEREQNAFNAEQASIDRAFQSAEAEKARNWQEQQYLQYNSPSALVRQYADAGINPALIAGGNMPAASTSTAAPSGAAAAGSGNGSPIDFVTAIIDFFKLGSEIKKTQAETENIKENTEKTKTETNWIDRLNDLGLRKGESEISLNDARKGEIEANINLINEQILQVNSETNLNNNERKMLMAAQSALAFAQKTLAEKQLSSLKLDMIEKQWRSDFIDKFNMSPELAGSLASAVGSALGGLTDNLFKLIPKLAKRK